MSERRNYRQCRMERIVATGKVIDTAWIPAKFAQVGKRLRIKDVDGWMVTSVGSLRPAGDFERELGIDGTAYTFVV